MNTDELAMIGGLMLKITSLESQISKINLLEARVEELERLLASKDNNATNKEESKVTRTVARAYVIEQIKENNPGVNIKIGNRQENLDLIMERNGSIKRAKMCFSKSYDDHPSGWHRVPIDDILNNKDHLFIFVVSHERSMYVWIYDMKGLTSDITKAKKMAVNKSSEYNGDYHFAFNLADDGRILESRDTEIDAKHAFNNWELISNYI